MEELNSIMEELELDARDEAYLSAIFMSVIEKFEIKCNSFILFRYIESSSFDTATGGVYYYNLDQLIRGVDDLILGLPDFSKVPEKDRYKAIEGFFAYQMACLTDVVDCALTHTQSWIKRIYRFIRKEGRVNKIVEEFGYKDSLETFKRHFIYPHLEKRPIVILEG